MTEVLALTADEAEKVRGFSSIKAGHALNPAPLQDGRFILGLRVLDDPAHQDAWEFLRSLPRGSLEKLPLYGPDDEPLADTIEVARLPLRDASALSAATDARRAPHPVLASISIMSPS